MQRKVLKGFANTLCYILAGDKRYAYDIALSRLGGGLLRLDLLANTASLNGRPLDGFTLVDHLAEWLRTSLDRARIPGDGIKLAVVEVPYTVTDEGRTHGSEQIVTMHFAPRSEIATDEKVYAGTAPAFETSLPDFRKPSPEQKPEQYAPDMFDVLARWFNRSR